MTSRSAMYDQRNWQAYLQGFCNAFKYLDTQLTDPERFPKGKIKYKMGSLCLMLKNCRQIYLSSL